MKEATKGSAGALYVRWGGIRLSNATALDDDDAVAQRHRFNLVVCNIDHGGLQALLQFFQFNTRRGAELRIQVG